MSVTAMDLARELRDCERRVSIMHSRDTGDPRVVDRVHELRRLLTAMPVTTPARREAEQAIIVEARDLACKFSDGGDDGSVSGSVSADDDCDACVLIDNCATSKLTRLIRALDGR